MVRRSLLLAALLGIVTPATAAADDDSYPFQLALFDPVQIAPADQSVGGVRLSIIYSRNHDVTGLDLLFVGLNRTDGDNVGVSFALLGLNWVEGKMKGVQYSSLFNAAQDGFYGVQLSGFINYGSGDSAGVQVSSTANVGRRMDGLQVGLLNVADEYRGLQVGFVNIVRQMKGVQIGLFNIITEGVLPFMLIANAMF